MEQTKGTRSLARLLMGVDRRTASLTKRKKNGHAIAPKRV